MEQDPDLPDLPAPPAYAHDTTLQSSQTDISAAIQLGQGILPPDSARRPAGPAPSPLGSQRTPPTLLPDMLPLSRGHQCAAAARRDGRERLGDASAEAVGVCTGSRDARVSIDDVMILAE